MRIPILTFGAIASILTINSVMADTTVTSKTYVDTTRQATIPAAGTNTGTAGTAVVTYTNTAGTVGERGIYDGTNDYDETTDANKLITAGAVDGMVGDVYDYVDDEISNIPAPELPTGQPNYVVTYDENGDIGGEIGVYNSMGGDTDALITASDTNEAIRNALNWAGQQIKCAEPGVSNSECTLWQLPNLGYGASSGQSFTEFVD